MGRADFYAPGDWNAICFRCGRKRKASTMRKQWQGYWVCADEWEPRPEQDFVRGVPDQMVPPWSQPKVADTFAFYCTPNDRTALPGFGWPGCMLPGFIDPAFDPNEKELS
jgi:hypothetical protein